MTQMICNAMKRLFKIILLLNFGMLLSSCEKDKEIMWVSIRNETDFDINCRLELADQSANGFTDNTTIPPGEFDDIYGAGEVNKNPIKLFSVYKSLEVIFNNADSTTLKFSPWKDAENYTQNPFTDTTAWHLSIFDMAFTTNTSANEKTVWNYEFIITEENVIK